MALKAYLDDTGAVLVTSTEDLTLEQVEGLLRPVVATIDPAPAGLLPFYSTTPTAVVYHKRIPGKTGAALGHYSTAENLAPLKAVRFAAARAKTADLIAGLADSEAGATRRAEVLTGEVAVLGGLLAATTKAAVDAVEDGRS